MENILMMSQKEECDNYNLIIEIIDKLVDMCDNSEAIGLRDEFLELFTVKYSEPLFNILGLQEEIGMDLLLALKCLLADKIYFISAKTNRVEYKSPTARSLKHKFIIFAFDNTIVEFKDYGKTFALTKEELEDE